MCIKHIFDFFLPYLIFVYLDHRKDFKSSNYSLILTEMHIGFQELRDVLMIFSYTYNFFRAKEFLYLFKEDYNLIYLSAIILL